MQHKLPQSIAVDQAIGMLAAALQREHEDRRSRRAEVLRNRLQHSDQPALRARIENSEIADAHVAEEG